jgi:hypothetical protein
MTTEGNEATFLETHNWGKAVNWGKAARFFPRMGFLLEFSTYSSFGSRRASRLPRTIDRAR